MTTADAVDDAGDFRPPNARSITGAQAVFG